MLRLSFVISILMHIAACSGCGDAVSTDAGAQVQDAGAVD